MVKKNSTRCEECNLYIETIEHLFWECQAVKNFWLTFVDNWNINHNSDINLDFKDIIYGYNIVDLFSEKAINLLLLIVKGFIYQCKIKSKSINFQGFLIYCIASLKYSALSTNCPAYLQDVLSFCENI